LSGSRCGDCHIPPITIDYERYSPLEAAWVGHGLFSDDTNARTDEHVCTRWLSHFVDAGTTTPGFVMANLDKGVKYVSLELIGAVT
jgi:hypothetical protein